MSNKNESEKIAQLTIDLEVANALRNVFETQVRVERDKIFFLQGKLFEKEQEIKKLQSDNSRELSKIILDLARGASLEKISQKINFDLKASNSKRLRKKQKPELKK